MLRNRLLLALSALVLLLLGVGSAGLVLFRGASREFDARVQRAADLNNAEKKLRVITSTLNSRYLAPMGFPYSGRSPERKTFDDLAQDMRAAVAKMQRADNGGRVDETVRHLSGACDEYLKTYENFFANHPTSQADRANVLQDISRLTQKITEHSAIAGLLYEEQLDATTSNLKARSVGNVLFIFSLMAMGVVIAVMIYFHLVRAIVDPVVSLSHSIQEVKRGNFELILPEPPTSNELSTLIPAFNEMAAELRQRRRESDDSLLRMNLQNRAIFTAIPKPMFVLKEDGTIDQLNPAAEILLARLGVNGRLPSVLQPLFEDCVRKRKNFMPDDIREAALFRIGDEEYYYLPRIFRFSTENGEIAWWAVVLMDVTRFRWLDEMKSNLLATVSHEIKTPLTGIRMVLHLLLEGRTGDLAPLQQKMVISARDDCERLLVTLKRLLDLVRVESGASQLQMRPLQFAETLERARDLFANTAAERRIELVLECETGLPLIEGDAVRLDEVVQNLISNALKHGPDGQPVTLRLAKRHDGRFLRLSVIDHGPGVPHEVRGRIFDKFYRVPGQKVEGVGLGLSIAREIVLAHGGRIGLSSANRPTEFHVDLPITQGIAQA
jgi:NtrC-family two-component system sensor histidine kinase KinB